MGYLDLTGKGAIVTGAAGGLCLGMAEGLMEAGASVCIIDINPGAEKTAQEMTDRGFQCSFVIADIADDKEREQAFSEAVKLLVGSEMCIRDRCQMAAKQFMVQQTKGKIINIASMLSFFGGYTVPAYAASKGAVAQITKAFCNEWAEKGINVNALAPGYMATEMNTALLDPENPRNKEITDRIPAHRWGTGEDMKGPCVFLASECSDYLNGAVIPVDGGYLVR